MKRFYGRVRLRRDNDYNYKKIENTFIPAGGEPCLVDVAGEGLKCKIGDGVTLWKDLPYHEDSLINQITGIVVKGYYSEGAFYADSAHTELINSTDYSLYIDKITNKPYHHMENQYIALVGNEEIEYASESKAGIMKLYNTVGENTDGTMTQKAISKGLDDKVEMSVIAGEETLLLGYSL